MPSIDSQSIMIPNSNIGTAQKSTCNCFVGLNRITNPHTNAKTPTIPAYIMSGMLMQNFILYSEEVSKPPKASVQWFQFLIGIPLLRQGFGG